MDRHVRRHSISILRDLVHEQKKFQKRTQNFPAGIATPTSSPLFDYVMESVGGGDAWRKHVRGAFSGPGDFGHAISRASQSGAEGQRC